MINRQRMAAASLPGSYDRLFYAFDIALPRLLPIASQRGIAADAARRQLADMLLRSRDGEGSAEELAEAALREFCIRPAAGNRT